MFWKFANLRIIVGDGFYPQTVFADSWAYESGRDYMVPPQHRKAFAQKADWFRMLARIGAKNKCSECPHESDRPLTASTPWRAEARKCIQTPVTYLRGNNVGSFAIAGHPPRLHQRRKRSQVRKRTAAA